MKASEIEAALERSGHLAWWQYLLVFVIVQVLVFIIFKQSSKMMLSPTINGGRKLRPTLSRLFSIPSMAYEQFNNSPQKIKSFSRRG
ncbi:hypothetical protein SUGI_0664480 [Cryptomeria japonica]|nr:hypothetical protein SUGI_0664480 [Cryptomeria japonica]